MCENYNTTTLLLVEMIYAKGEKLYAYGLISHNRHNFSPSKYISACNVRMYFCRRNLRIMCIRALARTLLYMLEAIFLVHAVREQTYADTYVLCDHKTSYEQIGITKSRKMYINNNVNVIAQKLEDNLSRIISGAYNKRFFNIFYIRNILQYKSPTIYVTFLIDRKKLKELITGCVCNSILMYWLRMVCVFIFLHV